MLYVEYKWAKRPGRPGRGIYRKSKRVGVRSKFVRGSQPGLARWKIAMGEYKPHEFFAILTFDNLSNWVENSPQCNPRLQAAHERHRFMRGNIARRYIERLKGLR